MRIKNNQRIQIFSLQKLIKLKFEISNISMHIIHKGFSNKMETNISYISKYTCY